MYQRQQPIRKQGRSNFLTIMLGCGFFMAVGVLVLIAVAALLIPRLPTLTAQVAGLSEIGNTDTVFSQAAPPPSIELHNVVLPDQVTVNLGSYGGVQTIDPAAFAEVAIGNDSVGQTSAVVTFSEDNLMALCYQRSEICRGEHPQLKNVKVDLRPGGLIVFADVNVPNEFFTVSQRLGVVLQLDASRRQFAFAGVDIDGQLFALPPSEYTDMVRQFEQTGNDLLRQVSMDAGAGSTLSLSEAHIDDSTLTLILR